MVRLNPFAVNDFHTAATSRLNSGSPRTRVLLISHTCISRTKGQPKADRIARMPGIDLRVLVPGRWYENDQWNVPDAPDKDSFGFISGKVNAPWLGPAQHYLHTYPKLREILLDFRPDVIDIWEEPWSLVSAQTCFLRNAFLPKAKIISETEQNINKQLPFPFEQLRSYTLKNADFVVGRSKEAVEVVRSKGYEGDFAVVPNGVDTQLFQSRGREVSRQKLGLTGFVAGYIGRLVEEKGLMDMVDALEFCPNDTHLLFMGDGPFKAALEEQAQKAGRSAQVAFLPGRSLEELPEVMSALDVFLLPSRTTKRWKEQFGRVIIEAQSCGTPVIGSDSGAIPAVIEKGGIIVPERNPQALAQAMNELAQDPDRRRYLGSIGREQVVKNHSWERVAEKMWNIYAQIKPLPTAPVASSAFAVERSDSPVAV